MNKSNINTYNRMAIYRTGLEAWKAMRSEDSPLAVTMVAPASNRTRSVTSGLVQVPPPSRNAGFARNAARVWNSVPALREAKTEGAARTALARFSRVVPL